MLYDVVFDKTIIFKLAYFIISEAFFGDISLADQDFNLLKKYGGQDILETFNSTNTNSSNEPDIYGMQVEDPRASMHHGKGSHNVLEKIINNNKRTKVKKNSKSRRKTCTKLQHRHRWRHCKKG